MAIVGWILLALVGLVVLVLIVPVRVQTAFVGTWQCRVWLFGCIPVFTLKPPAEKTAGVSAKEEKTAKAASSEKDKPSILQELKALYREEGVSGVLTFFGQLLRIVGKLFRGVARAVKVRRLELCVRVGGEEADDIAVNVGRVNAALYPTLTALSHVLHIRRKNVRVIADFTREDSAVTMRMTVWVWPFLVVGAALGALCRLVVAWMRCLPSSQTKTAKVSEKRSASVS